MKKILLYIFPKKVIDFVRRQKKIHKLKKAYHFDLLKYWNYSRTAGSETSIKLISDIIIHYHVIEKGLTMPESRLGFGKEKIISLCDLCIKYVDRYGTQNEQIIHAIQVILEYESFHNDKNYILDSTIKKEIIKVKNKIPNISPCSQKEIKKDDYFKDSSSPFLYFSRSRSSVRNYSDEDIPLTKFKNALEIAKSAPSVCNRQAWRTYIYTNKILINKILELQGGNRGFGHLANKLIVITGELGIFGEIAERNQVYIDGGLYAMNLLYSLHYYEIGACILNCSLTPEKDIKLRELCRVRESEVFIAMITCGIPPNSFKIANSKRYNIETTNNIIE